MRGAGACTCARTCFSRCRCSNGPFPAAGLVFLPLLIGVHYAAAPVSLLGECRRAPAEDVELGDRRVASPIALEPEESTAVLHGLFVGPIAPTVEQRRAIAAPALVIGHHADFIHPFSDATNLVEQLPYARLVQAASIFELRFRPERLVHEMSSFWTMSGQPPWLVGSDGHESRSCFRFSEAARRPGLPSASPRSAEAGRAPRLRA